MTCHNLSPQKTTVSEVTGSGFFGGSVGKSYKKMTKQAKFHTNQNFANIMGNIIYVSKEDLWEKYFAARQFATDVCGRHFVIFISPLTSITGAWERTIIRSPKRICCVFYQTPQSIAPSDKIIKRIFPWLLFIDHLTGCGNSTL